MEYTTSPHTYHTCSSKWGTAHIVHIHHTTNFVDYIRHEIGMRYVSALTALNCLEVANIYWAFYVIGHTHIGTLCKYKTSWYLWQQCKRQFQFANVGQIALYVSWGQLKSSRPAVRVTINSLLQLVFPQQTRQSIHSHKRSRSQFWRNSYFWDAMSIDLSLNSFRAESSGWVEQGPF